jgi:tetratricopeptide (TPR) repeat protein
MKMTRELKLSVFGIALLFLASTSAFSQCKEVKWPEDRAKAEESVAIYSDAMKQGNFRGATARLQWMLNNAPQWQTKLYIDGTEIYHKLASAEKDPAKKQVLVDSLMLLYDMRIQNCGDEINVLNRKVQYALLYNGQNKAKTAEVLAMYDKVFEISGNNVSDNNLEAYMKAIQLNSILLKNLDDEQVLQRYDKVTDIIDTKIKKAQTENKQSEVDRLKKIKSSVDDILIKLVKVDCDFVRKNLAPKFHQNPSDQNLSKKIFQFMTAGGCIDDPLWLEAAEELHKVNPDYGLAKNMAKVHAKNGNTEKAETFADEAVSLASNTQDKADAYLLQGDLLSAKGSKVAARESYRKALAAESSNKDAWEKIGDLYLGSFKDCAKQQSMAEDRLIYIAAYEMYAKAGNQQKMATARSQFPSVAEIFELNWKEGETKKLDCWVGETVVLRTRGKD